MVDNKQLTVVYFGSMSADQIETDDDHDALGDEYNILLTGELKAIVAGGVGSLGLSVLTDLRDLYEARSKLAADEAEYGDKPFFTLTANQAIEFLGAYMDVTDVDREIRISSATTSGYAEVEVRASTILEKMEDIRRQKMDTVAQGGITHMIALDLTHIIDEAISSSPQVSLSGEVSSDPLAPVQSPE